MFVEKLVEKLNWYSSIRVIVLNIVQRGQERKEDVHCSKAKAPLPDDDDDDGGGGAPKISSANHTSEFCNRA